MPPPLVPLPKGTIATALECKPTYHEWPRLDFDPASLPEDAGHVMEDTEAPPVLITAPSLPALPGSQVDFATFLASAAASLEAALNDYDIQLAASSTAAAAERATWDAYPAALAAFLAQFQSALELRQRLWAQERASIAAQITKPRAALAAVRNEIRTAQHELARTEKRRERAEAVETRLTEALAAERAPKDFGLLPKFAIRHIASFLRRREVVQCMRVCRRWRVALDRGYVWKHMLQLAVSDALAKAAREEEKAKIAAMAEMLPNSVTVNLRDPNKKAKHMTKTQVFDTCLAQVRSKVATVQSEREDLVSVAAAEAQVGSFLTEQVAVQRARLATARRERAAVERAERAAATRKNELMLQVAATEEKIKQAQRYQAQAKETTELAIESLTHRIRMYETSAAGAGPGGAAGGAAGSAGFGGYDSVLGMGSPEAGLGGAGGSTNPFDDDFVGGAPALVAAPAAAAGSRTMEEVTQEVKHHKKLLVRAVKQLRLDISAATQTNAVLEQQIRALGIEPPPRQT